LTEKERNDSLCYIDSKHIPMSIEYQGWNDPHSKYEAATNAAGPNPEAAK
jgi:hypothetical protein